MLQSRVLRAGPSAAAAIAFLKRPLYASFVLALLGLTAALAVAVVPRLFGYGTLVVHGGSMAETIPSGSLVLTRWLPAENVSIGDVVLMQEQTETGQARPKLHRVVSVERSDGQVIVQTKGDANDSPDPLPYILSDRVLTPAYHLPYLGYLVGFVATPLGWAILIALPGTVLCLATLRGIWVPDKPRVRRERHRRWAG